MLRAVLLSEPGSGATTFVGLFYVALTRLASERGDSFRFTAPPESLRRLSALYEPLVAGEFPGSLGPDAAAEIRFELAFSPPAAWRPFHRNTGFDPRFRVDCRWNGAGAASAARLLQGAPAPPGAVNDLLSCTAPIFLVDPRPTEGPGGSGPSTASDRDAAVVAVLTELARSGGTVPAPTTRHLHPIFVFTRLDGIPEEVAPSVPRGDPLDEDRLRTDGPRIGRELIDACLPRSRDLCRSRSERIDEPVSFFSYARPVPGAEGGTRHLQLRTLPNHRPEPVYPFTQFRSLIDHLGDLAQREP